MDTEKRIQRFSKIIIAELEAKSVHETKCFCERPVHPVLGAPQNQGPILQQKVKNRYPLNSSWSYH